MFGAKNSNKIFLINTNNNIKTTGEISIEPKFGINLLILFNNGDVSL